MDKNGAQTSIQDDVFYTYADKINPRKLTIEQLKKLGSFGEISDSDALEIIDELFRLTIITYKIYKKEQWD